MCWCVIRWLTPSFSDLFPSHSVPSLWLWSFQMSMTTTTTTENDSFDRRRRILETWFRTNVGTMLPELLTVILDYACEWSWYVATVHGGASLDPHSCRWVPCTQVPSSWVSSSSSLGRRTDGAFPIANHRWTEHEWVVDGRAGLTAQQQSLRLYHTDSKTELPIAPCVAMVCGVLTSHGPMHLRAFCIPPTDGGCGSEGGGRSDKGTHRLWLACQPQTRRHPQRPPPVVPLLNQCWFDPLSSRTVRCTANTERCDAGPYDSVTRKRMLWVSSLTHLWMDVQRMNMYMLNTAREVVSVSWSGNPTVRYRFPGTSVVKHLREIVELHWLDTDPPSTNREKEEDAGDDAGRRLVALIRTPPSAPHIQVPTYAWLILAPSTRSTTGTGTTATTPITTHPSLLPILRVPLSPPCGWLPGSLSWVSSSPC
jgi:hypothetical protein